MATGKRHSPEQIVRKLMAADRLLAEDVKRLKNLERENTDPQRLR